MIGWGSEEFSLISLIFLWLIFLSILQDGRVQQEMEGTDNYHMLSLTCMAKSN